MIRVAHLPLFLALAAAPAVAQEALFEVGRVTLGGGVGMSWFEANEYVYQEPGSPNRASQLIWQSSMVPTLSADLDVQLGSGWSIGAEAATAIAGNSHMVDYDWIPPFTDSFGDDDWSDRSTHPNTILDYYFSGSVSVGHNLVDTGNLTVGLLAGAAYRDIQWDSGLGGSYIYSEEDFRDQVGDFPDGFPPIIYRQAVPSGFIGVEAAATEGAWTWESSAALGLAIDAKAYDWHAARDVHFIDHLDPAPTAALDAKVSYALSPLTTLFAAAGYDAMLNTRADGEYREGNSGPWEPTPDMNGDSFEALTLTVGLGADF